MYAKLEPPTQGQHDVCAKKGVHMYMYTYANANTNTTTQPHKQTKAQAQAKTNTQKHTNIPAHRQENTRKESRQKLVSNTALTGLEKEGIHKAGPVIHDTKDIDSNLDHI